VHQLFKVKNGGLVATPFEYSGETLSKSAYSNDTKLYYTNKRLTIITLNVAMKKLSSLIKMELLQVIIQVHGCSQKTGHT
jgi:hypothetical protein